MFKLNVFIHVQYSYTNIFCKICMHKIICMFEETSVSNNIFTKWQKLVGKSVIPYAPGQFRGRIGPDLSSCCDWGTLTVQVYVEVINSNRFYLWFV